MKGLKYAFGAAFALVLGAVAYGGVPLPLPGVSGPSLGDPTTNLYSVVQGAQNDQLSAYFTITTMPNAAGTGPGSSQANCTSLSYGMSLLTVTLGATGSVCLPAAKPGTSLQIANNTSQTVDVYMITPTTLGIGAGGADYINGTVGTSAYGGLTNGKIADCYTPVAGNWWCQSGN